MSMYGGPKNPFDIFNMFEQSSDAEEQKENNENPISDIAEKWKQQKKEKGNFMEKLATVIVDKRNVFFLIYIFKAHLFPHPYLLQTLFLHPHR